MMGIVLLKALVGLLALMTIPVGIGCLWYFGWDNRSAKLEQFLALALATCVILCGGLVIMVQVIAL
jgi:hypothetical protein